MPSGVSLGFLFAVFLMGHFKTSEVTKNEAFDETDKTGIRRSRSLTSVRERETHTHVIHHHVITTTTSFQVVAINPPMSISESVGGVWVGGWAAPS